MKTFAISAGLAAISVANSTPIFGSYPGWTQGSDDGHIQIELFEDYLCADCQALNPVFTELLDTEWLGKTVRDEIVVGVTPFPLPYHVHTYQVNQLVPYFMALCDTGKGCHNNAYKNFAYKHLDEILSMTSTSQVSF